MNLNPQIINFFKNWQNETGMYPGLDIGLVNFTVIKPFIGTTYFNIEPSLGPDSVVPAIGGKYPVYAAGQDFAFETNTLVTNKLISPSTAVPRISFASNGTYSGANFIIHEKPFYNKGDRLVLKFNAGYFPKYFYYALMGMRNKYGFNWSKKANMRNLVVVDMIIPDGIGAYTSLQLQQILVEFLEYHLNKLEEKLIATKKLKADLEAFDKTFISSIFDINVSAENKQFIADNFDKWANGEDLNLTWGDIDFATIYPFRNQNYFSTDTPSLNLKQKNITIDNTGYPIYAGGLNPICNTVQNQNKLIKAGPGDLKISFATDGDSSAGTNFVRHSNSFYVNATRMVLTFLPKSEPLYFYYALLNMKDRYGFNYSKKANMTNLVNVAVLIPKESAKSSQYSVLQLQQIIVEFIESWSKWRDQTFNHATQLENILESAKKALISKTFP